MKKKLLILLALLISITFISCDEITDPIDENGTIRIESEPAGAQIWLDNVNTGKVTPSTITSLQSGDHALTLKLGSLGDSTFAAVAIVNGETKTINAKLNFGFEVYSAPVKIWETTGTSASQPSGLDLSTGNAYGTSDASNNNKIDIYYYSDSAGKTYIVRSSHFSSKMSRDTYFKVSTATNINDGINSPVKSSSWVRSISDRESKYVFLYDDDNNYSKLKITSYGGGSGSGDPAWIEVAWIYNKVKNDVSF